MAKLKRIHGLNRGKRLRLTIESLAPGGDGVGHCDGVAIFVARTAPGDLIEVELFDVRKSFARGKLIEILTPSRQRAQPACKVFDRCGGCQWQHIEYGAQLEAKSTIIKQALRQLDGVDVLTPLAADNPLRYRNKAQFPVQQGRHGELRAGYFEDGSHKLVDINECPVEPEAIDAVLGFLKKALADEHLEAYDEERHSGLIRHLCFRQSFSNLDILVTLVINLAGVSELTSSLRKACESVAQKLMETHDSVKGLCLNFNADPGNKIFGVETICIKGESEIEEMLITTREDRPAQLKQGLKFRLSSQSFFQINTSQAVKLFDEIYDQVQAVKDVLGRQLRIIDVYAGVGSIALWISSLAESVVAVEESADAVFDGHATLEANEAHNISFAPGKAEDVLVKLAKEKVDCDIVIIDPPRKGAHKAVLAALLELAPSYVIYVSCNPQTLARDLKILQDGVENQQEKPVRTGYKIQRVKPVDLFPQTYHVESVVTLERFKEDGFVGDMAKI